MSMLASIIALAMIHAPQQAPLFTDAERTSLQAYWCTDGRYAVALPPEAIVKGPWQVRLTPEGSAWLLKYQNAIGAKGVAPTVDPTALASNKASWKTWVQATIARDRRTAQDAADAANRTVNVSSAAHSVLIPNTQYPTPSTQSALTPNTQHPIPTPDPGPIPPSLLAVAGNPPAFASAVTPMQHSVTFDDGDLYRYVDNVLLPPAYAYYRFPQGVATAGALLPDSELTTLFASAGMSESERRIALAVSKLEGSFEAINTYDTGYVSVGFLQFITLDDGKHSLCEVLHSEKLDRPDDFSRDFHRFGIDITPDGIIDVVDPATGAELAGPDAVRKLVDDKRLIAVFQRAGRHSTAFRLAQIHVAKAHYWPADDLLMITTDRGVLTGKVSDVVRSEAGMATLFDRKVNRGSCEPISSVIAKVLHDHGLSSIADAAAFEREIVQALKYRGDFLKDATLTQPD